MNVGVFKGKNYSLKANCGNPYDRFIQSHHEKSMNTSQYERAYRAHEGLIKTVYRMYGMANLVLNNGKQLVIYIKED